MSIEAVSEGSEKLMKLKGGQRTFRKIKKNYLNVNYRSTIEKRQ